MDTIQMTHEDNAKFIDILGLKDGILDKYLALKEKVLKLGYDTNDARHALIGRPGNVINSYLFQLIASYPAIADDQSYVWQIYEHHLKIINDKPSCLTNYHNISQEAYFILFISSIESEFLNLLVHIPESGISYMDNDLGLKKLWGNLCQLCNLQKHNETMGLVRLIRNTLHAGVHIGKTKEVIFRGINYEFKHLQPKPFYSVYLYLELYGEIAQVLSDILDCPKLQHVEKIPHLTSEY